jgi:hypothetical protein
LIYWLDKKGVTNIFFVTPIVVVEYSYYSPGWIASEGQTLAQVPQSTHKSASIEYFSPSLIASDGHSSMQVPQAMQSSLIMYAINI